MNELFSAFSLSLLLPLLGAATIQLLNRTTEGTINRLTITTILLMAGFVILSLVTVQPEIAFQLFSWRDYHFEMRLELDGVAKIFWALTLLLGGIVIRFSLIYLHREAGYARFFSTLFFFLSGVMVVSSAGNLDTFMIGWEILGIASFLLIGFYRNRVHPVRNAAMVYSIYRLCDLGLLAGAYLEHTELRGMGFRELLGPEGIQGLAALPNGHLFFISALLIFAALGKSAQLPFSSWLPRAMEGPTPSSAIFYGALSIHAGALLLLRSEPIWSASAHATWMIGILGAFSALIASGISRTVSNIKSQIAYGSITQVGIIFVEIALGLKTLALIHILSNAVLRCYQLLASPSIVAHRLKIQGTQKPIATLSYPLPLGAWGRVRRTAYAFFLSDAYLQDLGRVIFVTLPQTLAGRATQHPWRIYVAGIAIFSVTYMGWDWRMGLAAGLAIALSLDGLWDATQGSVRSGTAACAKVFDKTSISSLIFSLSVACLDPAGAATGVLEVLPFSAGIVFWWALARAALAGIAQDPWGEPTWARFPKRSFLVFMSALGLGGFPISTVFFGEDLLLHEVIVVRPSLAIAFTGIFILNGIALIQTYSRFFFNPPRETA